MERKFNKIIKRPDETYEQYMKRRKLKEPKKVKAEDLGKT
jgi:hypothetical protein